MVNDKAVFSLEQIPNADAVRKRLGDVMSEARKLRALLKTSDAIEREELKKRGDECPS